MQFKEHPRFSQQWALNSVRVHPLYKLDKKVFWPDRAEMVKEAQSVRTKLEEYDPTETARIKIHKMADDTPLLTQMWEGFSELYGDFGDSTVTYFYIDAEMGDYGWHVDSQISSDMTSKKPILCAMNLVITDEHIPAEFWGLGESHYVAAMFNTSHVHRVNTRGENRILARITFRESIYEEIVHKIKKIHKRMASG